MPILLVHVIVCFLQYVWSTLGMNVFIKQIAQRTNESVNIMPDDSEVYQVDVILKAIQIYLFMVNDIDNLIYCH